MATKTRPHRRIRQEQAAAIRAIDGWNESYPRGTAVIVELGGRDGASGERVATRTASQAWIAESGVPTIKLVGLSDPIPLSLVRTEKREDHGRYRRID